MSTAAARSPAVAPRAAETSPVISEAGFDAAADLLRALANSHRLAIVAELNGGARCVHDLVEALGVSQPLVSQHLRILRASHLVRAERRGREIAYSLGDEHVFHIVHDAVLHAGELSSERHSMTITHPVHAEHHHAHDTGCGHVAVDHDGHTDFLHDGHRHASHDGHWDEH